MSRKFTLRELKTRLDEICDTENDQHISTGMKTNVLNSAYARVWGLLARSSPPDYMCKDVDFNTVADQKAYAIDTIAPDLDFWKLKAVFVREDNGNSLRPLPSINEFELQPYRAPQGVFPMRLTYLRACPKLSSGSDEVDGINGWEELMLAIAAQDILGKQERDGRYWKDKQRELEMEIRQLGQRDVGQAEHIIKRRYNRDPFYIYRNNVDGYRLRGSNLELYYRSGIYACP